MKFGVQTFTVRKKQKKSITAALKPLIDIGIRSFEIARIDFNERNAAEIKALVDECGIEICSVQVKPKYVFGDPEKIIAFCERKVYHHGYQTGIITGSLRLERQD